MAIAYDATSSHPQTTGAITWTKAHTCSSGTGRILVVGVMDESSTISGVTYAGVAMTQILTAPTGFNNNVGMFYLVAPATGANNIIVTNGSSAFGGLLGMSFTGVDQTSPIDGSNKLSTVSTTTPTLSVTTTTSNSWVVDFLTNNFTDVPTVGAGQTSRADISADGRRISSSTEPTTTAGAVTMSWTVGFNDPFEHLGIGLRAAGGGGSPVAHNLTLLGVGS